jgi:hypothetical protein
VEFLIVLVLLLIVVVVVTAPLRRLRVPDEEREASRRLQAEREVAELEAARDAKYREIRDAQLDRDTGKLSQEDFGRVDAELRGEAIALLQRLDRAQAALQELDRHEGAGDGSRA